MLSLLPPRTTCWRPLELKLAGRFYLSDKSKTNLPPVVRSCSNYIAMGAIWIAWLWLARFSQENTHTSAHRTEHNP